VCAQFKIEKYVFCIVVTFQSHGVHYVHNGVTKTYLKSNK